MSKWKKNKTPVLIKSISGIDLEAAYGVLLKAFIRIQVETNIGEEKGDNNATLSQKIQTTEHQGIQHSHD